MNRLKLHVPGAGFIFIAAAFVFMLVAFALYFPTYARGGYSENRWVIMSCAVAMWLCLLLLANSLFFGEKPNWAAALYVLAAFLTAYAAARFIQPCLTQIGIYFTVNMGDPEMNRDVSIMSIVAEAFYVLALISIIVAAFLPITATGRAAEKHRE